jgi:acyl transferase domain-containing protein/thioester reductase-like protein
MKNRKTDRTILVTGATGFLGSELLRRLAAGDEGAELVVALRPRRGKSAGERANALEAELLGGPPRGRIRALEVDFARPDLGLAPAARAELGERLTDIFHLAAEVRFDLPIEEARAANVAPARALAELAGSARRFSRFHHVSTYAVARRESGLALEEPAPSGVYRNTYEQTKAEAESWLLSRAGELPLSIYRTSVVGGDSRTGWTPKFDTFYLAIRLFLSAGAEAPGRIPVLSGSTLDAVTVDFVADALFELGFAAPESGTIFHLTAGARATPVARVLQRGVTLLAESLRRHGRTVPRLPEFYEVGELSERELRAEAEGLGPDGRELMEMFRRVLPYATDTCVYDCTRATRALEGTGIEPRPIHDHLPALLDYCVRSDWGKTPEARPPVGAPATATASDTDIEPIAIIGLGGVFPGSLGVDAFARDLFEGRDAITDVPRERWDPAIFHSTDSDADDRTTCKVGGFIRETGFDEKRFRLPPLTSRTMDRLQKLVLVAADEALAGVELGDRSRTAMFLGYSGCYLENDFRFGCRLAWSMFRNGLERELPAGGVPSALVGGIVEELERVVVGDVPPANEDTLPGTLANVAVGRVMNFFDLRGPSCAINAGDGSALAAFEQAIDALRSGECDSAIAGGGHALLDPTTVVGLSKERILSSSRARPFDRRADGTVLGEGVGLFVLKRLSDALRSGDRVHALIRGVGRASTGRARAVTTAFAPTLETAIADGLRVSGVAASEIGFVETHGSGIPWEDRAELEALERAFPGPVRLGAMKERVGHLLGASGAASAMKCVLALRERRLPPEGAAEEAGPGLASRFAFARRAESWASETPRLAGVCSFGNWGQAFHLVLEEFDERAHARWRGRAPAVAAPGEPVAVVGLGAVLPSAENPERFWENLQSGRSFVSEFPEPLWEGEKSAFFDPDVEAPDRTYGSLGAFAPEVSLDVSALGIPPVTAARMDPNQLHFLEAAMQAARGFTPGSARASVVVGECSSSMKAAWAMGRRLAMLKLESGIRASPRLRELGWDRARLEELASSLRSTFLGFEPPIDEDSHAGALFPVAAAYFAKAMDARHGHLTADAACASSLAALSIAVRELRAGKQDIVFAGGVGMSITPLCNVMFARCRALSGTGSRPLDATADGMVLGEGSVVFALKRLADARRDGDKIHAVIRGVGGASDGAGHSMMAPDPEGQTLALRRALSNAGCEASSVQLVECHATGTRVGDEVEVTALERVYRPGGASERPLLLGAVKAQVGHTIGAAGAVGLLKTILGFRHGLIAPTPLATRAEQSLRLGERGLSIVTRPEPWPPNSAGQPRRAGVSSFGFGGTDWHAIVEEPAARAEAGRGSFKTAFLYPGHGSPYVDMGAGLYDEFLVFRRTIEEANETLLPLLGKPLEELVFTRGGAPLDELERNLVRTDLVQPILLAFNIAFHRCLRDGGLAPDVVCGHSVGEFSAAVAAGVLELGDALSAAHERGRIYRELQLAGRDTGTMAAVLESERRVRELLAGCDPRVGVAGVNCPSQTTISGPARELAVALERFRAAGIETRRLGVEVAWHSPLATELGAERARAAFGALAVRAPRVHLLSNVDGRYLEPGVDCGARFRSNLVEQLGRPGDFAALIRQLHADGVRRFVEVGPKGILTSFVSETLAGKPHSAVFCDHPRVPGRRQLERALAGESAHA